ncbi:MAG: OmpA family protein [Acidobacteriaceae bacterium]
MSAMKRQYVFAISTTLLLAFTLPTHAQLFSRLKDAASRAKEAVSSKPAPAPTPAPAPAPATTTASAPAGTATAAPTPTPIAAYQNYDFTPGKTIIFADDFNATQDGEFPDQWELKKGQGAVNKQLGFESLALISGNYVQVIPRMKTQDYLGNPYTIELDVLTIANGGDIMIFMENGDNEATISTGHDSVTYNAQGIDLSGNLPEAINGGTYDNHWHHIALAVKNNELKVYVDQYRVLVVPDMKFTAHSLVFGGVADQDHPIIFTNVRVASGGDMNMIGQKFTDAKIVTHGINFDIDKAILRPESMGTLNQIKRVMDANPDLKFEVDGHTDNTGTPAHNLTLSQLRADAVMQQLVKMGVSASRLTAKGFGDTKPIAPNDTLEGKANNRRVEFVRAT